jgi:hypothetical protein
LRGPELHIDELIGTPTSDSRPHGRFATRSPRRPNPIGLTNRRAASPRRHRAACSGRRYAGWDTSSRYQALPV